MGHTEEEWEAGTFMTRIARRVSSWSRFFPLLSSCVLAEGRVLDASASPSASTERRFVGLSEKELAASHLYIDLTSRLSAASPIISKREALDHIQSIAVICETTPQSTTGGSVLPARDESEDC